MTMRLLSATALALTLALPLAAGAEQSAGVSQETKAEQSSSASVSTEASQLMADAKARLNSAMVTLADLKDAAGDRLAEAREDARVAVDELETALQSAKAQVSESSRDAWEAAKQRIAEARATLNDDTAEPREIANSLGAVDDAAGNVELKSGQTASADAGGGTAAEAGAKVSAETGTLQTVELVGKTLYGADQEAVGEIQDVVLSDDGTVESVLVDVGGFLGIGAKRVAIPVDGIEVQGEQMVAANLTRKQAEAMPEYKAKE